MTAVSGPAIATVLSLQTLSTCIIFTLGQYIYAFYLEVYASLSVEIRNSTLVSSPSYLQKIKSNSLEKCIKDDHSLDSTAQAWAQQRSADLFFWTNLWSCGPTIVMTYILGLYTPKLGRRFVLLLPMLGTAVQVSIWLSIIYYNLPEYWWYIAAFIVGLSGSDNVRNFVLNLYITESTIESERSSRFVLFGAISMIVSAIGTFGIGYFIAWQGFNDLYWTALILQIISIIIVIFFFKSDRYAYKTISMHTELDAVSYQMERKASYEYLGVCTVFRFGKRSRKKSISLLLTLLAYASFSFIYTAFIVLLLYLLTSPFCWSSKQIGNYSASALITFAIFSVLGMKILTKLGACDIVICIISHTFFFIASIWVAFAHFNWQMYAALIICSFAGYQNLLTSSMISKWLESYERTNAFTFVTEINTIMKVLGYCFFNWVYARTVIHFKNFTFLLAAGLTMIPLLLNVYLWYISRSMKDDDMDPSENIDLELSTMPVVADWPTQIGDGGSLLLPQRLSNSSRNSSISSTDYQTVDHKEANFHIQ